MVSVWRAIRFTAATLVGAGLAIHYGHALFGWFARGQYDAIDTWLMDGLLLAAAAIALLGAWRSKAERPSRFVLAAGISSYALAYVVYNVFLITEDLTFPTVSDFMWLAFYPAAAICLGAALRREIRRKTWLWLDAAVNALALVAVGWVFVVAPATATAVTWESFTLGQSSYMVGDLALAGMLVALLTASGFRGSWSWALAAAGVVAMASADVVLAWLSSTGTDVTGMVVDPLWVTGMLLFACSCWFDGRRTRSREPSLESPVRAAVSPLVALAALIAVVMMSTDSFAEALVLAGIGMVCLRLGITLRANRGLMNDVRSAERAWAEQARTDPLTSLGNRRALEAELSTRTASGEPFTFVCLDLNGFKTYNDRFGHAAGDVLLRRMGIALATAVGSRGNSFRPGGDEFCVLLDGRIDRGQPPINDVLAALTEDGLGFAISAAYGIAAIPDEAQDAGAAERLADQRMYGHKRSGRKSTAEQMSELLMRVVAEREPGLHAHSYDVVGLARQTASRLECTGEDLDVVARAAEQHDVGKLAIPDSILRKPGPLDSTERELVRQHPMVGERILAGTPALRPVALVVRSCHEHWDGNGYPDGLVGDAIPFAARIIAVCDAYSAMVTDRPYRTAMSETDAFAELRRCSGSQFDPSVVEALISSLTPDAGRRASTPTAHRGRGPAGRAPIP